MSDLTSRLLTQKQADRLKNGMEIEVTWSGGNGPHRYTVQRFGGIPYAGDPRNDNPLRFVGRERYHTHVTVVSGRL